MKDAAPAPDADTTSWKDRPARYWRDPESGQYHRVAFARVQLWSWIGGRGYVPVQRVMVWNPTAGDIFEEAADSAAPGERFAAVMTEEQFARKTFPAQAGLPPIGRHLARRALTARPGAEQVCRFIKRTNGELRAGALPVRPRPGRRALPGCGGEGLAAGLRRGVRRTALHQSRRRAHRRWAARAGVGGVGTARAGQALRGRKFERRSESSTSTSGRDSPAGLGRLGPFLSHHTPHHAMKDIIDGKRYDTDTAEEIATGTSSGAHPGDFEYYRETLYETDNGAWFLAGEGGPKTKYASPVPGGGLSGGSGIHPLTSGEAMSWMEAHSALRALEKHFPDEIEDA